MTITLHDHQTKEYLAWIRQGRKGTIKAATGSGKTVVALKAIEDLKVPTIIVVPTVALQRQWKNEIESKLGLQCSLYGGGDKVVGEITVAIIDSIRHKSLETKLLVLDESHRYPSSINFIPIVKAKYQYILALSATPERKDEKHLELFKIAPVVFDYGVREAINDGVISDFFIINVPIEMELETKQEYTTLSSSIREGLADYQYNLSSVTQASGRGDLRAVKTMRHIAKRRAIMSNSKEKIEYAALLLKQLKKTIVFSESIQSIEQLSRLSDNCVLYHSGMTREEKRAALEKFKSDPSCNMLSAKALDEGLDVPECETAVILSGTSSVRQFKQRIGRVLRKREGKFARIYRLYLRGTKEADYLRNKPEV